MRAFYIRMTMFDDRLYCVEKLSTLAVELESARATRLSVNRWRRRWRRRRSCAVFRVARPVETFDLWATRAPIGGCFRGFQTVESVLYKGAFK